MDEKRRLALQFLSHKALTSQEFALALIGQIADDSKNQTKMLQLAEILLTLAPAGGDGW